jgi:hypothetical protein
MAGNAVTTQPSQTWWGKPTGRAFTSLPLRPTLKTRFGGARAANSSPSSSMSRLKSCGQFHHPNPLSFGTLIRWDHSRRLLAATSTT